MLLRWRGIGVMGHSRFGERNLVADKNNYISKQFQNGPLANLTVWQAFVSSCLSGNIEVEALHW